MSVTSTGKYVAEVNVSPIPETEVLGQVMFAYIENIRAEEMAAILQKYGLTDIQPNQWYPYQLGLDFERALGESDENGAESLVAIGIKIIDQMPFPAEVTTIPQALETGC